LRARALALAQAEVGTGSLVATAAGDGPCWQFWAAQVVIAPRLSGAALLARQNLGKRLFDRQTAIDPRQVASPSHHIELECPSSPLVEQHGGYIRAAGSPGNGATVTVRIPIEVEPPRSHEKSNNGPSTTGGHDSHGR